MQNSNRPVRTDPLNFIAEAYWEDFKNGQPIDGGVLFEKELRACHLDSSLASLKRVDTLLDSIQAQNKMRPDVFMQAARSRNLVLFVGFYLGRVLTHLLQTRSEWLGQSALIQRYPNLHIHPNNPFHFLAMHYQVPNEDGSTHEPLFFVLEPIAMKIFGNKLKMPAVVGTHIAPSLFEAVIERLPKDTQDQVLNNIEDKAFNIRDDSANANDDVKPPPFVEPQKQTHSVSTPISQPEPAHYQNIKTDIKQVVSADAGHEHINNTHSIESAPATTKIISPSTAANPEQASLQTTSHKYLTKQKTASANQKVAIGNQKVASGNKPQPLIRLDDFKELRAELEEHDVTQKNSVSEESHKMYERASKVLGQVDKIIAKSTSQGGQISSVELPEDVLTMRKKALVVIKKSADAGHTGAMLRLAIYFFLGEGVKKDERRGFELIEKAAKYEDNRGQRQLSRLYYKGLGVEQDMEKGKYWLEKAAENGHSEAASVVQNWKFAQTLIDDKKSDETSDRKYLIIIGAVVFVMILIVLMVDLLVD